MKYVIDEKLNTKEYQQNHSEILKSDDVWKDMIKDKNMVEYKELLRSNNYSYNTSYTLKVKDIPLQIKHREIMETGMKYLTSKNVIVSLKEYFTEYNNWYPQYCVETNSKSEVNMSCEDLSNTTDDKKYKDFINGNRQYLDGWIRHLGGMIEPEKVPNKSGDKTGKYSSLFQQNDEWISEVSGSNS